MGKQAVLSRIRTQWLVSSSLSALALAVAAQPAWAQAPASTAQTSATGQVAEVIVTGSRTTRNGFQAPTPLTVINPEKLEASADANIAVAVTSMPVFGGSGSTVSNAQIQSGLSQGVSQSNLRGLGSNRTLVLLDGHRLPPVNGGGYADLNTIPQELVSRVDVVTGGASAVYGSDAVAGVVNFILNKQFTGLKAEVSGGMSAHNDYENYKLNVAAGAALFGGRGHVLVAAEDVYNDGVEPGRRDWQYTGLEKIPNPAYGSGAGQTTSVPQFLNDFGAGYSNATKGGIIFSGPLKGTAFGPGGTPYTFTYGPIVGDPVMVGGDWKQTTVHPSAVVSPRERRVNLFGRLSLELTKGVELYGQVSHTTEKTKGQLAYAPFTGTGGPIIKVDNAFLPDSVRAQMVARGLSQIQVGTLNAEWGYFHQFTDRSVTLALAGLRGEFGLFGSSWSYDAFYQRSKSDYYDTVDNNMSKSKYALATDAVVSPTTGQIVCRSALTNPSSTCRPWNPLGIGLNQIGGPGYSYIFTPNYTDFRIDQDVMGGSVTGEAFSGWAGPVVVALNVEHRKETASQVSDPGSLAGDHPQGNFGQLSGSSYVTEGGGEVTVPLARNQPWAENWDVNGAVRLTDYQLSGSVKTWKVGTTFSPVQDVMLRASRSRDIRAPNLSELFAIGGSSTTPLFDPVTGASTQVLQRSGGNPNLTPEIADTTGLGAVLRPSFAPGLGFSVDWWNINIRDAISGIGSANIINLCANGSAPSLCQYVTRVNGSITQVLNRSVNVASQKMSGIDFELIYSRRLSDISPSLPGSLALHANVTKYIKNVTDNRVNPPLDSVGELSNAGPPRWRWNATLTYDLDRLSAAVTMYGFPSGTMYANYIQCTSGCPVSTANNPTTDNNYMPGANYVDLSFRYTFDIGRSKATAFFNVRNLTDVAPAVTTSGVSTFTNGAAGSLYDLIGRQYRLGIRFEM